MCHTEGKLPFDGAQPARADLNAPSDQCSSELLSPRRFASIAQVAALVGERPFPWPQKGKKTAARTQNQRPPAL